MEDAIKKKPCKDARVAEVGTTICSLRLLTNEEQRIAFAVLEGMRLQKQIDGQKLSPVTE